MPVIPSFGNFAKTPDYSGSYLGGFRSSVEIAQHAHQLQLERQKLAQAAQIASMEASTRREIAQMANLRSQQENEIQKSYQMAQLGLRDRELQQQSEKVALEAQDRYRNDLLEQQQNDVLNTYHQSQIGLGERGVQNKEAIQQFKVGEAANKAQAQAAYQAEAQRLITDEKLTPQQAYQQAAMKYGPQMSLPSGAYTQAFKAPEGDAAFGGFSSIANAPTNMVQFQTGPRSRQLVTLPTEEEKNPVARPAPGLPPQYKMFGKRVINTGDPTKEYRAELKVLEKAHDNNANRDAYERVRTASKPDKLPSYTRASASKFKAEEDRIKELRDLIEKLKAGPTASGTNAAAPASGSATNSAVKRFKYVNGKLVPQ